MRPIPVDEKEKFVGNFLGTLIKLGYGGIWEVRLCPGVTERPNTPEENNQYSLN